MIFKLNIVNFSMKTRVKLLWLATRQLWRHKALKKVHVIVDYAFLFPLLQEL